MTEYSSVTLYADLAELAASPEHLERFLAKWSQYGGRVFRDRRQHIRAARSLLADHCRADAQRILIERYGISRSTAYRALSAALQQGPIKRT